MQGGDTTINGLRAFVGTFQGSMQSLGQVVARVAYVPLGRTLFRFAGIAQTNSFSAAEEEFSASVRTFRELSAREADNVKPNRIDLYTVRAGETWQSIAQGPSGGNIAAVDAGDHQQFPAERAAAARRSHQDRRLDVGPSCGTQNAAESRRRW